MFHAGLARDNLGNMHMSQVKLWQLAKLMPPRLSTHLETYCALPVLYASSWFLTCYASDFPLAFAARVMDLMLVNAYQSPLLKVRASGRYSELCLVFA